jgi:hypothetical protein
MYIIDAKLGIAYRYRKVAWIWMIPLQSLGDRLEYKYRMVLRKAFVASNFHSQRFLHNISLILIRSMSDRIHSPLLTAVILFDRAGMLPL